MEQSIIKTVTAVFNGTDERNWQKVQQAMAENVYLDYSSLSGNPAASIPAEDIITAWKNFMPGFDKTHHQIFNFKVSMNGERATVHFDGKADHFIDNEIWTVEGNYDAEVINTNDEWRVTKLRFNLLKQSGNLNLPVEAGKRMAK